MPSSPWADLDRPPLRAAGLVAALTTGPRPPWRRLEVLGETGSTNADVVARALAGEPEGLVVTADHQSAGRGRLARSWTAPPRSALAVSVLLRPGTGDEPVPLRRWSWIGLLAALAVRDVLVRQCGLPAELKWPNDVLVGGRKVCGVLAEVAGSGPDAAVVLGAGLNVSQTSDELPVATATSLRLAGAASTARDTVLRAYLRALAERYRRWRSAAGDPRGAGVAAAYREACSTIGHPVLVQLPAGEALLGLADGVDDDGRLVLRAADGTSRALPAGDVVHVRPA